MNADFPVLQNPEHLALKDRLFEQIKPQLREVFLAKNYLHQLNPDSLMLLAIADSHMIYELCTDLGLSMADTEEREKKIAEIAPKLLILLTAAFVSNGLTAMMQQDAELTAVCSRFIEEDCFDHIVHALTGECIAEIYAIYNEKENQVRLPLDCAKLCMLLMSQIPLLVPGVCEPESFEETLYFAREISAAYAEPVKRYRKELKKMEKRLGHSLRCEVRGSYVDLTKA